MPAGVVLLAKSQLRHWARHPVGPVTSVVGVALAVLAVTAVHLVSETVRAGLAGAGGVEWHTHVATRPGLLEEHYFDLRRRWRNGELPGVEALFPVIDSHVRVGGRARRLIGFDPLAGVQGVGAGLGWRSGDSSPGRFLLDDVLLVAPADAVAIRAASGRVADLPVALEETGAAAGVVFADLPTAQRLLRREGELDAVWLRVANTRSRLVDWADGLLPGIAAALPRAGDPAIDRFRVTSLSRWNPARRFADASAFNLGMLALLSLLMAAFLAVQASRAESARRALEHRRLLALGVSRRELRGLAMAQGLLLGAVGAAVGLAAGALAAAQLAALGDLDAAPVDAKVVAKGLVVGALACAFAPVWDGWLGREGDAGSGGSAAARTRPLWRRFAGLAAVAALVGCLVHASLPGAFAALLLASFLQVAYVVPALIWGTRSLARFSRSLVMRANLRSVSGAHEGGGVRLALAALSVAAAAAIGMGLMVESLRRDFHAMLDQLLWEGVYVRGERGGAAFDLEAIRALAGVREVRRYGDASGHLAEGPVTIRLADLDVAEAARYGLRAGAPVGALLNETAARAYDLGVGDVAHVTLAGQRASVPVAHVFQDYRAGTPILVLPRAFRDRLPADAVSWRQLAVVTEPDAAGAVAAAVRQRHPAADVRDHAAIRAAAAEAFDRSFAVSKALTALAVGVAVVGLYAALTALRASREREFRLLAAVGYSRSAIGWLALTRRVVLGTLAAIAAAPLGLGIAWVLCAYVNPLTFGWRINLGIAAAPLWMPLLLCLAGAVLAGARSGRFANSPRPNLDLA